MFSPRLMALTVATLFTLGIAGNVSAETILDLEDFYNYPGTDQPINEHDWFGCFDKGLGTVDRSTDFSYSNRIQIRNSHLIGSTDGDDYRAAIKGCVLYKSTVNTTELGVPVKALLGTNLDAGSAVELEDFSDITFSWEQWNLGSLTGVTQAAIKIDSTWYVNTEIQTNSVLDGSENAYNAARDTWYWRLVSNNEDSVKTVETDLSSSWYPLSFTLGSDAAPDAGMTLSTPDSLPATGTITGVGIYSEIASNSNSSIFLGVDNFQVTGAVVPEPSAVVLLIVGSIALCFGRRRS